MKLKLLLITIFSFSSVNAQLSLISDINASGDSNPYNLIVYNNELFFNAHDAAILPSGFTNVYQISGNSSPSILTPGGQDALQYNSIIIDNKLYISQLDINNGLEKIVEYDGNNVVDIFTNAIFLNSPRYLSKIGNELYYYVSPNYYKYDGVPSDGFSGPAFDIILGNSNSNFNISNLEKIEFNGEVLLVSQDTGNDEELYKMDNTANSLQLIKNINPNGPSDVKRLTEYNGKVYFRARDGINGSELWVTDGTETGTVMLKNINLNTTGNTSSIPSDLIVFNNKLYFNADDGSGSELWATDGTSANTTLIADIGGFFPGNPNRFYVFNNELYFSAYNAAVGRELFKMDTAETVTLVSNINLGINDSNPMNFAEYGGKLYFVADDGTNGIELWSTDGTSTNTQLVGNINVSGDSNPENLTVYNNKLYFAADDGTNGVELWSYLDPTLTVNQNSMLELIMYPNPSTQEFKIKGLQSEATVSVFDINGREVLKKSNYLNQESINISNLSIGTYFVKVNELLRSQTLRLIKD